MSPEDEEGIPDIKSNALSHSWVKVYGVIPYRWRCRRCGYVTLSGQEPTLAVRSCKEQLMIKAIK